AADRRHIEVHPYLLGPENRTERWKLELRERLNEARGARVPGIERAGLRREQERVVAEVAGVRDLGQPEQRAAVGARFLADGHPLLGGRVEEAAAQVDRAEQLAALARRERDGVGHG